ncbi:MAG TPA: hypothetical protein VNK96_01570 [Fimbriimonadales bacterium]|nr:hypothetical protein [Fimbriimonadales bacterium]
MDWSAVAIIFIIFGMPVLIPIVAILLHHRRKMLELMQKSEGSTRELSREMESLRKELKELKTTLLEHSLSLDNNVENLQKRLAHLENRKDLQDS